MTTITGIHTVGIPVADQDRALAFYVGTLGFESRLDADIGDGMRWPDVPPMFTFRDPDGNTLYVVASFEG